MSGGQVILPVARQQQGWHDMLTCLKVLTSLCNWRPYDSMRLILWLCHVLQLIAKYGPELSSAVIDNMAYGEAVVKEVLRVAPPSDGVQRRTLVDMEVSRLRQQRSIHLCP